MGLLGMFMELNFSTPHLWRYIFLENKQTQKKKNIICRTHWVILGTIYGLSPNSHAHHKPTDQPVIFSPLGSIGGVIRPWSFLGISQLEDKLELRVHPARNQGFFVVRFRFPTQQIDDWNWEQKHNFLKFFGFSPNSRKILELIGVTNKFDDRKIKTPLETPSVFPSRFGFVRKWNTSKSSRIKPEVPYEIPSGYLTVRHGSHGPFIDGLPGFTY